MRRITRKNTRVAVTTVKLPLGLNAKVLAIARRRRATKSIVIREALEAYRPADFDAPAEPGSFLEVAAEFAGCLEGPADLSFNKKHLEGYGR